MATSTQHVAKLSYLRQAPRKVRSVGDLIKGLSVNEAEAQLMVQSRRPAKALLKLLRSAVSNAKNKNVDPGHLYIVNVRVDGGPMLKRILPRARGSASPIEKKMSHVTLVLGENANLSPRFTIVPPKKTKLPPGEDKKRTSRKRTTDKPENQNVQAKKSQGFWKRTFSRKKIDQ